MKKFILASLLLLWSFVGQAQELFPLQQVADGGTGCTPVGSACPVGITAPAGYHFNMTLDDEFTNDTQLNTAMWAEIAGSTISFDPVNGVSISTCNEAGKPGCGRVGFETYSAGNVVPGVTEFFQRYGVWEWSAKMPSDQNNEGTGYHPDFWFRAQDGTGNFTATEDDINENWLTQYPAQTQNNFGSGGHGNPPEPQTYLTYPPSGTFTNPASVNMGNSFNTYATYWMNDGSARGTQEVYFNGVAQPQTIHTLVSPYWDNGVITIMTLDNCPPGEVSNGVPCSASIQDWNPLQIRYIRVWQLEPTIDAASPQAPLTVTVTPSQSSGGGGNGGALPQSRSSAESLMDSKWPRSSSSSSR